MTTDDLIRTAHPFLEGLSKDHLETLASFAMPVRYSTGEAVFREGDMADRFYLINEGSVSLRTSASAVAPIEIQQLRSGDVLGWSWLFEPYLWQYDAIAAEPTAATFFYGTWLREQCEQNPVLGYEIMKRVAGVVIARLQATRKALDNVPVA